MVGYGLLAMALLAGLTKVYYGRFVDEADNITVGWLISQGYVLYRDLFSHHFPFPYYWVAGVVSLFGNSFVAVRVSVLLLQVGLAALSMRLTRFYLPVGAALLAWNLINQFHRGQEAIYPAFGGAFLLALFLLVFALLIRRLTARRGVLAGMGVLAGLAVLTNPLNVYPVGVALGAIFLSGFQDQAQGTLFARKITFLASNFTRSRAPGWRGALRAGLRRALWAAIPAVGLGAVFGVTLFATGSWHDFYRDALWFNAEIYAKYVPAEPARFGTIAQNILSGLDVFNPRWYQHRSPFLPLVTYRSVSLENEAQYFSWIFSGFLFRLSVLGCVLGLALNRKAAAGIFLYVYSAALLNRAEDGLYTISFTLVSLFAAFYLLAELPRPALLGGLRLARSRAGRLLGGAARLAWPGLLVVVLTMQLWSAARGGLFLAQNWGAVTNANHVNQYRKFGESLHALTCGAEQLELSVFPTNPIVHFVTGIPPASRYTFMYPWVAEVGQQDLIADLRRNPSAVVWINLNRKVGLEDGVYGYLGDTIDFLDQNYITLTDGLWMSPELARRCPVTAAKVRTLLGVSD